MRPDDLRTADTAQHWQELLRSDDANIVRSREDWDRLIADPEQRELVLPGCDEESVKSFSESLLFRNGGLAGADYSMLIDFLTVRRWLDLWKYFGIAESLAKDYDGYRCESQGTCGKSATDICTSNC